MTPLFFSKIVLKPQNSRLALFIATAVFAHALQAETAIDFSCVGYQGGGVALPLVPTIITVEPVAENAAAAIQSAINQIAQRPVDTTGFRGTVLLKPGRYAIATPLHITTSGIVLRGEKAILVATSQSRQTLVQVSGNPSAPLTSLGINVTTDAQAGSRTLSLANLDGLAVGTPITIRRPSTKEWIQSLAMNQFKGTFADLRLNWLPGSRDLIWNRTITSIDPATRTVTLDAPITTAIEARFGGATVQPISTTSLLQNIGIENLTLESEFDPANPCDEEHAWIAIQLDHVENAWVRDITTRHFVSAAVWLGTDTRMITVQDCHSESPIGEDAGWRRFGFYAGGQQILAQRCSADQARQPFLAGLCAAGPNVFLDCSATHTTGDSGSIESWASGTLFDNVKIEGGRLILGNLGTQWQGAGWNAANSIAWNCTAEKIIAENPPGATNQNLSNSTKPSLYRAQLAARKTANTRLIPTTEIPKSPIGNPPPSLAAPTSIAIPFGIANGRFTARGKILFGGATSNAWWKGQTVPARAEQLGWSATRWAPGRTGPGLTEDLPSLAEKLASSGNTLVQVWPGLWYDRRRDAHVTTSQPDAEAWAPFYESPWARSGQGRAADGLSKYDLSKFNPWYWDRLREFATECARRDMILYHHFYNHHNLVEAAAHWAEFPWRSANCLQETGFPEPPPFTNNGSHIALVAEFYDISNPVRRELHRLFIWHGLDALGDQPNVIHTLAFQFAGPLTFQQFFLDTVAEWQCARGKKARIVLNTSKTNTDAILSDPKRAPLIDAIDQRYWQYLANGSLFAPHSDGKTAFREDRTEAFGKDLIPNGTPALVYKQVREYHDRFPEKAIIAGHAGQGPIPILMAGGALPLLADYSAAQPLKNDRDDRAFISFIRGHLAVDLAQMQPVNGSTDAWCLSDHEGKNRLYYSPTGAQIAYDRPIDPKESSGLWFDPKTGTTQPAELKETSTITKPSAEPWLLLLQLNH